MVSSGFFAFLPKHGKYSRRAAQWFSRGCPVPSTAHGARSAAATELRRCDGVVAASLLRRSC